MNPDPTPSGPGAAPFRRTLLKVIAVQVGALLLLWLLQARYTG